MGCALSVGLKPQLELINAIKKQKKNTKSNAAAQQEAVSIFKKLLALEEDFMDNTDPVSE
jgi:hypothetical protein